MTDPTYALGRSDNEHARLTEQANFLRPLTERLFRRAGMAPGMKVLDVGSGVGDVAFLLAELVGPDGTVVGVDIDGAALEKARIRAEYLKLRNVEFIRGDIRSTELPGLFDTAVGRLVLLYFADPVGVLARIATQVRSKGIVAFQEMEMNDAATQAHLGDSLAGKVAVTICRTFAAAGVHVRMASDLPHTFMDAGLKEAQFLGEFVVGGPDLAACSWIANTMRSLAPLPQKVGISLEPLADLDTLAERLHSEAVTGRRGLWSMPFVGAFAQVA